MKAMLQQAKVDGLHPDIIKKLLADLKKDEQDIEEENALLALYKEIISK